MKLIRKLCACALVALAVWMIPIQTYGCNVPVFRYALERWERDMYQLIVASQGELSSEHQLLVDQLHGLSTSEGGVINLKVISVDVTGQANAELLDAYPELNTVTEPTAVLLYPQGTDLSPIILQEPFSRGTVRKLVSSSLVEELTVEVLAGTSAVWVFVDSGNAERDDQAYATLLAELDAMAAVTDLPQGVIETTGNITGGLSEQDVMADYDPDNVLRSGIPLKIGFSVKRLSREKAEPVFRSILLNAEEGLEDYTDQPMAYPVFGRGRFLFPLVGKGINAENIERSTIYICGICSCQVKSGNPGIDLLSHADWDSFLDGSQVVHDRALPPLVGVGDWLADEASMKPVVQPDLETNNQGSPLVRNLLILCGVTLLLLIGLSFLFVHKP